MKQIFQSAKVIMGWVKSCETLPQVEVCNHVIGKVFLNTYKDHSHPDEVLLVWKGLVDLVRIKRDQIVTSALRSSFA